MPVRQRSDIRNMSDFGVYVHGNVDDHCAGSRVDIPFRYDRARCSQEKAKLIAQSFCDTMNITRQWVYQSPVDRQQSRASTTFEFFHIKGVQS